MEKETENKEKIHETVDKEWERLNKIWYKVGHDRSALKKRRDIVLKNVEELFGDFVSEETEKMTAIEEKLEELRNEILQLLKDLTLDTSIAVSTQSRCKGKTLLESEKIYLDVAEDLRKQKAVRMKKYDDVNVLVQALIEEMNEDPFIVEYEGIPSDAQVAQLESKLSHLRKDKVRRNNLFTKLKKTIRVLFGVMENIPKNELERIICMDESPQNVKILSSKNLREMEEMQSSLHQEIVANREKSEGLWRKIKELWSRLTIDEEVQMAFEKVHKGVNIEFEGHTELVFKPTVLRGLQSEFRRLEEEKRRNMALFIGQVRDELVQIWAGKCFMSDWETRFSNLNYDVTPFTVEDFVSSYYEEELLEKHEEEAKFWRDFVERNKKLIDSVTQWNHMFQQHKDLDLKSDDPSRLANRGGALLKEGKERKILEKKLPKTENEIKLLCKVFEDERDGGHGMRKFLFNGKEVPTMMQESWDNFFEEKEQRKEKKKEAAAGKSAMMTTQLGPRAAKRPATPSTSGLVTPKRARVPASPLPGTKTPIPYSNSTTIKHLPPTGVSNKVAKKEKDSKAKKVMGFAKKYLEKSTNSSCGSGSFARSKKLIRKSIKTLRKTSLEKSRTISSASSLEFQFPGQEDVAESSTSMAQTNRPNLVLSMIQPTQAVTFADLPPASTNDNFTRPATRSARKFATPATASGKAVAVSRIPSVATKVPPSSSEGKEQLSPLLEPPMVLSPVHTYTEFTSHLLGQSTMNSSTMAPAIRRNPLHETPAITSSAAPPSQHSLKAPPPVSTPIVVADDDDW